MMNPQALHETVVTDILDTMRDGINWLSDNKPRSTPGIEKSGSISKATSGLTLVFPFLITRNCPIEQATMISKALEQRHIALLQMAFSAYNITNSTDAIEHLQKFHTNMSKKMDLDSFMDAMESLGESNLFYLSNIAVVNEDCKRNINYTLTEDINPKSLLEYSEINSYAGTKVISEAPLNMVQTPPPNGVNPYDPDDADYDGDPNGKYHHDLMNNDTNKKWNEEQREKQADRQYQHDRDTAEDNYRRARDQAKDAIEREKINTDRDALLQKGSDNNINYLKSQLLPQEAKKANEMQPSLMIVNFYVNDRDKDLNIAQQVVAGVKSKMYPIDSSDIIYRIITKHADGDLMLKLVKVSTREISFVKDFLLGVDQAKLDAVKQSKKSSSAMFKALERRALKGKIRKSLRLNNNAKAIATLAITMDEVEELRKRQNIDVTQPRVIIPIMEKLCLLNFIIIDMASESIMLMADGDTEYEHMSFSALEKSSGDSTYKKVINLMTKISR